MTSNPRSREAAFADLVGGLIDARVDAASERFDAELEAAEAAGRLDPASARLLRWWQRESVRAVTDHARTTIPTTLVALERAAADARDAVHSADAAWTTARGVTARATYPGNDYATEQRAGTTAAPTPQTPPPAPWGETAEPEPASGPFTLEPPGYPSDPVTATEAAPAQATGDSDASYPPPTYASAPEEAPSIVDLTDPPLDPNDPTTPGLGRRRTLLAGLTVLPHSED